MGIADTVFIITKNYRQRFTSYIYLQLDTFHADIKKECIEGISMEF